MSDELPETWPLRPSQNSTVTHGLCMALVDIVHGERMDFQPQQRA